MNKEKFFSALISVVVTIGLALCVGIMAIEFFDVYGKVIFLMSPTVCGILAVWIFNRRGRKKIRESLSVSLIAGCMALLGFLAVGLEGLICLLMAAPVVLPLFLIGGLIGYGISHSIGRKAISDIAVMALIVSLPFFMGFESASQRKPVIRTAITTVEIKAPIESVWNEVIQFSEIPEPQELLFRIGIAYPTNARIEGRGVGAVRYCNFSTGSFVEPITHWDENEKLAFDVVEQPKPMTEISPWAKIDPPHLDWAIRSVKGQFLLREKEDGIVELEGTTWFYTSMGPEPYWSFISKEIIHSIHKRVLNHIKSSIETEE